MHIISLLGRKRNGDSEFAYYPFRSCREAGDKPTFQEWLHCHSSRRLIVHEFPTTDLEGILPTTLEAVVTKLKELVARGKVIVVIDSAGAERTARVCTAAGFRLML